MFSFGYYVHWRLEKTNPLKCEENSSFGILWHKDLVQTTAEDQDQLNVFLAKSVLNLFFFFNLFFYVVWKRSCLCFHLHSVCFYFQLVYDSFTCSFIHTHKHGNTCPCVSKYDMLVCTCIYLNKKNIIGAIVVIVFRTQCFACQLFTSSFISTTLC